MSVVAPSIPVIGMPMFPTSATRRPSLAKMCAISEAVVLFPLVPVTQIVVRSSRSANHRFNSDVT